MGHGEQMQKHYKAFLSYSHSDTGVVNWLHKGLETYNVPKTLVGKPGRDGPIPKRLIPIFRDREELPTAVDLGAAINMALDGSDYLIVVCSPRSAKSLFVNEEILTFKRMGKQDRIMAIIIEGEPNGTDKPGMEDIECFPPALKFIVGDDGELSEERTEPIAADMRDGKDGKNNAKLKLIAGLLGVNFDDLAQREKKRQKRRQFFIGLAASAALMVGAAVLYNFNQLEQQAQTDASQQLVTRSAEALEQGDVPQALALARAALPMDLADPDKPYLRAAEIALYQAVEALSGASIIGHHSGAVSSITASKDESKFLSTSANGEVTLWGAAPLTEIGKLEGHEKGVTAAAFSDDGKLVATLEVSGELRIFDTSSLEQLQHWTQYASAGDRLEFASNSSTIIVTTFGNARAWDARTGKSIFPDTDEYAYIYRLSIDGDHVIYSSRNGLYAYAPETRTSRLIFEGATRSDHLDNFDFLQFYNDGKSVLYTEGNDAFVTDIGSPEHRQQITSWPGSTLVRLDEAAGKLTNWYDRKRYVWSLDALGAEPTIEAWAENYATANKLQHKGLVSFGRNDAEYIPFDGKNENQNFHVKYGKEALFAYGETRGITSAAAVGDSFIIGDSYGSIRRYSLSENEAEFFASKGKLDKYSLLADKGLVFYSTKVGILHRVNYRTGEYLSYDAGGPIQNFIVDEAGQFIALASTFGSIIILDAEKLTETSRLPYIVMSSYAQDMYFSSDGAKLFFREKESLFKFDLSQADQGLQLVEPKPKINAFDALQNGYLWAKKPSYHLDMISLPTLMDAPRIALNSTALPMIQRQTKDYILLSKSNSVVELWHIPSGTRLFSRPIAEQSRSDISANGSRVLLGLRTDGSGVAYAIIGNLQGTEITYVKVLIPAGEYVSELKLSQKGDYLIAARNTEDGSYLERINIDSNDGKTKRLAELPYSVNGVQIMAGNAILAMSNKTVSIINGDGTGAPFKWQGQAYAIDNSGQMLLLVKEGERYLLNVTTQKLTQVMPSKYFYSQLSWAHYEPTTNMLFLSDGRKIDQFIYDTSGDDTLVLRQTVAAEGLKILAGIDGSDATVMVQTQSGALCHWNSHEQVQTYQVPTLSNCRRLPFSAPSAVGKMGNTYAFMGTHYDLKIMKVEDEPANDNALTLSSEGQMLVLDGGSEAEILPVITSEKHIDFVSFEQGEAAIIDSHEYGGRILLFGSSRDQRKLLTVDSGGAVTLLIHAKGESFTEKTWPAKGLSAVALNASGSHIIFMETTGAVRIENISSGVTEHSFDILPASDMPSQGLGMPRQIWLSDTGAALQMQFGDSDFIAWKVGHDSVTHSSYIYPRTTPILGVQDKYILALTGDGLLATYPYKTGETKPLWTGDSSGPTSFTRSRTGKWLAGSSYNALWVWSLEDFSLQYQGSAGGGTLKFSPSDDFLTFRSDEGSAIMSLALPVVDKAAARQLDGITAYQLKTPLQLSQRQILRELNGVMLRSTLSADGMTDVSLVPEQKPKEIGLHISSNLKVLAYDTETGRISREYLPANSFLNDNATAVSGDASTLALMVDAQNIEIHNITGGASKILKSIDISVDGIWLNNDGSRLFTNSGTLIREWDVQAKSLINTITMADQPQNLIFGADPDN